MINENQVHEVEATSLHALRRKVLRNNDPGVSVADPRDGDAEALHLAVIEADVVVACGSFYPSTAPTGQSGLTYQLRYLATDFDRQTKGLGSILMRAAEDRLRSRGVIRIWANGRDTALGFYQRTGWSLLAGSEHLSPETQLPHTVITKELFDQRPVTFGCATPADIPALVELRAGMMYAIDLTDHGEEWQRQSRSYFEYHFERDALVVVVARTDGGEVVASAAAELRFYPPSPWNPRGASAYVHTVSTKPAFRRRGISLEIMKRLIEELRVRDVAVVDLHATPQGMPLYTSLGFALREPANEMRLRLEEL